MTSNERCRIGQEPDHALRNLFRLAHPANRFAGNEILLADTAAINDPLVHRSAYNPRTDAVHTDILGRIFECGGPRQPNHAMLRGIVSWRPCETYQPEG
jgi:hypothetical protein